MTYVDTDYILALAKEKDWLKEGAGRLNLKADEIETSAYTLIELLFYAHNHGTDAREIIGIARSLVSKIRPISSHQVMAAAHYMKKYGLNPGDAIHAASLEENEEIVTSDEKMEKAGFKVRKIR